MQPLQLLCFLYKALGFTISDLVEVVLFPLFLQHTNLVEYVYGLKIIFRFYHYPVHKNRDAISADLQIKNRPAYHGARGGTRMNHTTRTLTNTKPCRRQEHWWCQGQSHIILERKQTRISSQHPETRLPLEPCFYIEVNISFIPPCLLPLQMVLKPRNVPQNQD